MCSEVKTSTNYSTHMLARNAKPLNHTDVDVGWGKYGNVNVCT